MVKIYAQIYKIDANGLAKKGYRLYDLDQQILSRRVFREIRLKNQEILGIEFFWAQSITVLMIVSIIFYKKPNSVWIELIKKGVSMKKIIEVVAAIMSIAF